MIQQKSEVEKERQQKVLKLEEQEMRMKQKESQLGQQQQQYSKKEAELNTLKDNLAKQLEVVNLKKGELDKAYETHIRKLEDVAKLTARSGTHRVNGSIKRRSPQQGNVAH
jgi:ribonuclease Y